MVAYLKEGDPNIEGGMEAEGPQRVVRVHDRMDSEIHQAEEVATAVVVVHVLAGVEAEGGGDDVMIVVQEMEGTLAQNDEDRIHELENLRHVEEEDPSRTVPEIVAVIGGA